MSSCRDLRLYLRSMDALGMLCATYDASRNCLYFTKPHEKRACLHMCLVLLLSAATIGCMLCKPDMFTIVINSKTGNILSTVISFYICSIISMLYVIFYIRRCRHLQLVQRVLRINHDCLNNRYAQKFRNIYLFYIFMFITNMLNLIYGFSFTKLPIFTMFLNLFMFGYGFLVTGLLLIFYKCINEIIVANLSFFNKQLDAELSNAKIMQYVNNLHIRDYFYGRHALLTFCANDLNDCFGLFILPITSLILAVSPMALFYLFTFVFEHQIDSNWQFALLCFTTIYYIIPWWSMYVLVLGTSNIAGEANRTVKILSRIPRTSPGLNRMVEKFLLKNLRKQPILTAYGFFSLDKSTFFKLFTAIFTYIVILVQFKEMEQQQQVQQT